MDLPFNVCIPSALGYNIVWWKERRGQDNRPYLTDISNTERKNSRHHNQDGWRETGKRENRYSWFWGELSF